MRSTLTCARLVLLLLAFASRAEAIPITYELTGTASGQIGATVFSNALVKFTGTGDTGDVVPVFGGAAYATGFDP